GLGVRNVDRILQARRWHSLRLDDLIRLRVSLRKVMPFIETTDHHPAASLDKEDLRSRLVNAEQLDLFPSARSVYSGQI
ncbi:MAG: Biotin synthase, partial [Verrucomicrobiales bacterium]|nr:Biotin synthase [Verrucomicrobiales bacterium]